MESTRASAIIRLVKSIFVHSNKQKSKRRLTCSKSHSLRNIGCRCVSYYEALYSTSAGMVVLQTLPTTHTRCTLDDVASLEASKDVLIIVDLSKSHSLIKRIPASYDFRVLDDQCHKRTLILAYGTVASNPFSSTYRECKSGCSYGVINEMLNKGNAYLSVSIRKDASCYNILWKDIQDPCSGVQIWKARSI